MNINFNDVEEELLDKYDAVNCGQDGTIAKVSMSYCDYFISDYVDKYPDSALFSLYFIFYFQKWKDK